MNPELDSLIKAARSTEMDAKTFFGKLNVAQLNWKPNAESWSVGQCLEHLIAATSQSFPTIEQIASGNYKQNLWTKLPFLAKFFGDQILKAVAPETKRLCTGSAEVSLRTESPTLIIFKDERITVLV